MKLIKTSKEKISEVFSDILKCWKNGGLVVYPSDTVYGFLADASDDNAISKLINVKRRPFGKPISVFLPDFESIDEYVQVSSEQRKILKELLPGPFTIVLPSKHKTSRLIESERGTLGIRIPDYSPVQELVKLYGKPVTATSANISGKGPHYTVDSFLKTLSEKKKQMIDLVVDVGKLPFNKPSTVIDLSKGEVKILRKGDVVLQQVDSFISSSASNTRKIAAFLLKKNLLSAKKRGLVIFLEGDLGAGKTEFVKGMARVLGIEEIISPTFVGYYEYEIQGREGINKLIHFDLYQIEDERELDYYNLEQFLKPGNIVAIEWGGRVRGLVKEFSKKAEVLYLKIEYLAEKQRKIIIEKP